MDTVGTGLLSVVGRLSLSQRLCLVCYNQLGASSLSVLRRLSASQSVHYRRFHYRPNIPYLLYIQLLYCFCRLYFTDDICNTFLHSVAECIIKRDLSSTHICAVGVSRLVEDVDCVEELHGR